MASFFDLLSGTGDALRSIQDAPIDQQLAYANSRSGQVKVMAPYDVAQWAIANGMDLNKAAVYLAGRGHKVTPDVLQQAASYFKFMQDTGKTDMSATDKEYVQNQELLSKQAAAPGTVGAAFAQYPGLANDLVRSMVGDAGRYSGLLQDVASIRNQYQNTLPGWESAMQYWDKYATGKESAADATRRAQQQDLQSQLLSQVASQRGGYNPAVARGSMYALGEGSSRIAAATAPEAIRERQMAQQQKQSALSSQQQAISNLLGYNERTNQLGAERMKAYQDLLGAIDAAKKNQTSDYYTGLRTAYGAPLQQKTIFGVSGEPESA